MGKGEHDMKPYCVYSEYGEPKSDFRLNLERDNQSIKRERVLVKIHDATRAAMIGVAATTLTLFALFWHGVVALVFGVMNIFTRD